MKEFVSTHTIISSNKPVKVIYNDIKQLVEHDDGKQEYISSKELKPIEENSSADFNEYISILQSSSKEFKGKKLETWNLLKNNLILNNVLCEIIERCPREPNIRKEAKEMLLNQNPTNSELCCMISRTANVNLSDIAVERIFSNNPSNSDLLSIMEKAKMKPIKNKALAIFMLQSPTNEELVRTIHIKYSFVSDTAGQQLFKQSNDNEHLELLVYNNHMIEAGYKLIGQNPTNEQLELIINHLSDEILLEKTAKIILKTEDEGGLCAIIEEVENEQIADEAGRILINTNNLCILQRIIGIYYHTDSYCSASIKEEALKIFIEKSKNKIVSHTNHSWQNGYSCPAQYISENILYYSHGREHVDQKILEKLCIAVLENNPNGFDIECILKVTENTDTINKAIELLFVDNKPLYSINYILSNYQINNNIKKKIKSKSETVSKI